MNESPWSVCYFLSFLIYDTGTVLLTQMNLSQLKVECFHTVVVLHNPDYMIFTGVVLITRVLLVNRCNRLM